MRRNGEINEAIEILGGLVSQAGGKGDDALDVVKDIASTLKYAQQMAHSPYRDPATVLREVRGALGLDRHTPDPAGGAD